MAYTRGKNLERGHSKLNRIAEINRVLEALTEPLTPDEIEAKTGIPKHKLNDAMLAEMGDYDMIRRTQNAGGAKPSIWTRHKPKNIERLKDDMMGAKA